MTPTEKTERSPEQVAEQLWKHALRYHAELSDRYPSTHPPSFQAIVIDAIARVIHAERDKVKFFTLNPDIQELAHKLACNVPAGEDAEMFSKARDEIAKALQAERSKRREIVWPSEEEISEGANKNLENTANKRMFIWGANWLRKRVEQLNK